MQPAGAQGQGSRRQECRAPGLQPEGLCRSLQSANQTTVRDGTTNATGDHPDEHALQDEPPSGPSRIILELPNVSPPSHAIPSVSLLKTLVRSQKSRDSGTFGQRCTLKTNHFVVSLPKFEVYKYDVCICPEDTSSGVNRAVMGELISIHRQYDLNGCLTAYDGRKHLYTATPLPFTSRTFEIKLHTDGQALQSPMRLKQFRVIIKFVARVELQPLGMNLTVEQEDEHQVALQALDTILQEIFIERSCPISEPLQLGEGLEIRQEFCKSLQLTQMEILLNIDVSSTVFLKPMHVMDYIALLLDRSTLDGPLCDGDLTKIKKALEGVMVQVTNTGDMHKTYHVFGLTKRVIRELPAPFGDHGAMKTFVDYFKEKYGYNIQRTELPCLEVGTKHMPILLPMEVCKIAEGQRYSKQLNRKQMSSHLEASCLHPLQRKHLILQTVECYGNEESYAKEFGIEIKKQLFSLDARLLPPPWLKFHCTGMTKEFLPRVGKWNMVRKRMYDGGRVSNWACVNFACDVEDGIVRSFCHELVVVCQASGMDFLPDPVLPVVTADPKDVDRTLKSFHKAMSMLKPQGRELDLLIVILPNNKSSLYGKLKRICETELGLVSQCCLAKHVLRMRKRYLANVALKINVKVGGKNTVLCDALKRRLPGVGDIPTIIFGAHVMHTGTSDSTSIAAVVASQDWPEVTDYAASASAQANGQELILDLFEAPHVCETGAVAGGMVTEHLIAFHRRTGLKPERIIYYRDAVSEKQLYQVMWQEIVAIKKACSYLELDYNPSVTYVVLQKHRHTRFFADNKHNQSFDGSGNILPGTVVDSDICHPNEFGFYLCSQIGTKGMVQPVYYHILWDENRFTADTFQCLTNYLCYTYARCTHSVSIVPPVHYAHLMASRGRLYMEPMTSETRDEGHAASPSEESSSGALQSTVARRLPVVKDNVKRGMFYC